MTARPLLALTMGDPAGVGPEVIARAWSSAELHRAARPVVLGHPRILERAAALVGGGVRVVEVATVDAARPTLDCLPCLRVVAESACDVPPAAIDPRGGQAAYDGLLAAVDLALEGRVAGLVTAPLHKQALHLAGHHYPGHTELLAERCGAARFAMMLYLESGAGVRGPAGLGVVHVTLHCGLAEALGRLSVAGILEKIELADAALRRLAGTTPRIGVAALNPHAGEGGLFGDEEQRLIAPAVQAARENGVEAAGPFPADTLLVRARDGEFDAVVAMYHDQGHIALKLLGMHRAVNVTLGLPIVRTSVAHGTAFDLAWQGRAETSGLVAAVRVAARLAEGCAPATA